MMIDDWWWWSREYCTRTYQRTLVYVRTSFLWNGMTRHAFHRHWFPSTLTPVKKRDNAQTGHTDTQKQTHTHTQMFPASGGKEGVGGDQKKNKNSATSWHPLLNERINNEIEPPLVTAFIIHHHSSFIIHHSSFIIIAPESPLLSVSQKSQYYLVLPIREYVQSKYKARYIRYSY